MNKIALVLVLSALASHPAIAATVYKIGFDVKNAHIDDYDDIGARIAVALKRNKLLDACVDLRQTGAAISGGTYSGGYGLVSHVAPSAKQLKDIAKAVCNDYLGCVVTPSVASFDSGSLSIVAETFERKPDAPHFARGVEVAKKAEGKLPRFSKGCETGVYADSWNDAASTLESRAYLKKIGINVNQARTLSLRDDKSGDEVWGFGFPTHDGSGDTSGVKKKPGAKNAENGA